MQKTPDYVKRLRSFLFNFELRGDGGEVDVMMLLTYRAFILQTPESTYHLFAYAPRSASAVDDQISGGGSALDGRGGGVFASVLAIWGEEGLNTRVRVKRSFPLPWSFGGTGSSTGKGGLPLPWPFGGTGG